MFASVLTGIQFCEKKFTTSHQDPDWTKNLNLNAMNYLYGKPKKRASKRKINILDGRPSFIFYYHSGPRKASYPSTPCSSISEHFSHRAHLITLIFRRIGIRVCYTENVKNFPLLLYWWVMLEQRPLPSGLVTSGSHCAVRLGHSSAWVITRSYRNGVFFFQI